MKNSNYQATDFMPLLNSKKLAEKYNSPNYQKESTLFINLDKESNNLQDITLKTAINKRDYEAIGNRLNVLKENYDQASAALPIINDQIRKLQFSYNQVKGSHEYANSVKKF